MKSYTVRYIGVALGLTILVNSVLAYIYYDIATEFSQFHINIIKKHTNNIPEICDLSNCTYIQLNNNTTYHKDSNGNLQETKHKLVISRQIGNLKLSADWNVVVEQNGIVVQICSWHYFHNIIKAHILLLFIMLIFFSYIYSKMRKISNRQYMMGMVGRDSAISDKYMRILNENIHHELNTPVAIISGKITKIESDILSCLKDSLANNGKLKYIIDLSSFNLIHNAIEQIIVVMERMSNFKQIKYSNGNKSVYDILYYAGQAMTVFNKSNFTLEIDEDFKYYTLDHKRMSNGDLLNIVSNHLRNSIEARSTKIIFQCRVIKNKMHLFIVDNGDGIRKPGSGVTIKQQDYEKVFMPYYTSKDSFGNHIECTANCSFLDRVYRQIRTQFFNKNENLAVRGVGLYLNRQLLVESGGNLELKETSSAGTVFELSFGVEDKDK